jgi:hypothetical protein
MNINKVILNMCIVANVISCAPQGLVINEELPDTGVPRDNINQQIIAYAPDGWNDFSTRDTITLEVVAAQNEMVLFRPDNVRIFSYENGVWHEIKNMVSQHPTDFEYILDPNNTDPSYRGSSTLLPELSNPTVPVDLKIFVFGFIMKNGEKTEELVGAFVDIHLSP